MCMCVKGDREVYKCMGKIKFTYDSKLIVITVIQREETGKSQDE